ncbi:MAG: hypothetical protein JXB88_08845, partial [Spirochaetales bacterium]|nr:hypothetical protein [Spirochaetales bacterium]
MKKRIFLSFFIIVISSTSLFSTSGPALIRAALRTLDIVAEESADNPQDNDLKVIKDFFFENGEPKQAVVNAFILGSIAPSIFDHIYWDEGNYPNYGDTGLFYSLLLSLCGEAGSSGSMDDENVAFGLGALCYYLANKHLHPVVNLFAGNAFGEPADHDVVTFELENRELIGNYIKMGEEDDSPRLYRPDALDNKKRHLFLEYWFAKEIFSAENINSSNDTEKLADDFAFYGFEQGAQIQPSQVNSIMETFKKLWNTGQREGINPVDIQKKIVEFTQALALIGECHKNNRDLDRYEFLKALGYPVPDRPPPSPEPTPDVTAAPTSEPTPEEGGIGEYHTSEVFINFQPADSEILDLYMPDHGEEFGERENGLSYGWNYPNTNMIALYEYSFDPIDTGAVLDDAGNNIWEITLPDGPYIIILGCIDDPEDTDINNITIEDIEL